MARPRIPSKNKVYHPLYSVAYLERRYDRYYVVLKGKRTNTELDWIPENKALALKMLEQIVAEYLLPKETEAPMVKILTVGDALRVWLALQQHRIGKDTMRKIKNSFTAMLPKTDFLLKDVEAIRQELLNNLTANSSISSNTKHYYLKIVKRFFAFCVEEGYCERNPVKKTMFPKTTSIEREAFTAKEMQAILAYFEGKADKENMRLFVLLLRFLSWTGVRINEALSIEWQDIDSQRIFIRHGKGGYQREIPLAPFPELRQVLADLEKLNPERKGKVFYWNAYAKLELWLRKGLQELGIKGDGRNFHSIRKMFENKMLNEMKLPAHIAAQIVGHTVAIQQKHYLKTLTIEELTETMEKYLPKEAKKE